MSYTIQCTITKLSSDGSVMVKGCEGYRSKIGDKEYNVLINGTESKLCELSSKFEKGSQWGEWEFALLRDAVCNNKRVELIVADDLKSIEFVSIIA